MTWVCSITWQLFILLLQWLALTRSGLGDGICAAVATIPLEVDSNIQLEVDCSQSPRLVTWSTPYPIVMLSVIYSCSDASDIDMKTKYYAGTITTATFPLESIESNGSCIYFGCIHKFKNGLFIPVLFTNVTCKITEPLTDITPTPLGMSSTYPLSHMETTSYSSTSDAISITMMKDYSATSAPTTTSAFGMATIQLPSSVDQLTASPLPTTSAFEMATMQLSSSVDGMQQLTTNFTPFKAGISGISRKPLLIILVPSLLLFIFGILAISFIIFTGYSKTRKQIFLKRATLDKLKYTESSKYIDTNNDSLVFLGDVESPVSHSDSVITLLDSLIKPKSSESRKQGKEHKFSSQSLNLGVPEAKHYSLESKHVSNIDRPCSDCGVVAGTSFMDEDGTLMKVGEGCMCVDSFHGSVLEGRDAIVMRKLEDNSGCVCGHSSGYESSSQYFDPEDIHDHMFNRCHKLDGTYFEYNSSSLPSDKTCLSSTPQDNGEEERRMTADNRSCISHFSMNTSSTGCVGTSGVRKHIKIEKDTECEEDGFPTSATSSSCESFGDRFDVMIVQSLMSTSQDDSGFNSNSGCN